MSKNIRLDPRAIVALLALVGYAAVARAVDNLYPLSTFSMYAGGQSSTGSRLLARDDDDGTVREIEDLARLSCDDALNETIEHERCKAHEPYATIPYIDRAIRAQMAARSAPRGAAGASNGRRVTLVRRIFRFAGPGAPRAEDCAITHCSAERAR